MSLPQRIAASLAIAAASAIAAPGCESSPAWELSKPRTRTVKPTKPKPKPKETKPAENKLGYELISLDVLYDLGNQAIAGIVNGTAPGDQEPQWLETAANLDFDKSGNLTFSDINEQQIELFYKSTDKTSIKYTTQVKVRKNIAEEFKQFWQGNAHHQAQVIFAIPKIDPTNEGFDEKKFKHLKAILKGEPIEPEKPAEPQKPVEPTKPVTPPVEPTKPAEPQKPAEPPKPEPSYTLVRMPADYNLVNETRAGSFMLVCEKKGIKPEDKLSQIILALEIDQGSEVDPPRDGSIGGDELKTYAGILPFRVHKKTKIEHIEDVLVAHEQKDRFQTLVNSLSTAAKAFTLKKIKEFREQGYKGLDRVRIDQIIAALKAEKYIQPPGVATPAKPTEKPADAQPPAKTDNYVPIKLPIEYELGSSYDKKKKGDILDAGFFHDIYSKHVGASDIEKEIQLAFEMDTDRNGSVGIIEVQTFNGTPPRYKIDPRPNKRTTLEFIPEMLVPESQKKRIEKFFATRNAHDRYRIYLSAKGRIESVAEMVTWLKN